MGTLTEGARSESSANLDEICVNLSPADSQYIVLENLYHGFSKPSVLDIKLGSVLTDDLVSAEKRDRLASVSASTTSGSLGLRICGMKVYLDPSASYSLLPVVEELHEALTKSGDYLIYNKLFGRRLTKHTLAAGLAQYIPDPRLRALLTNRFHQRLQLIYNCLIDTEVRIFSGSLLFVYESDPACWVSITSLDYDALDPIVELGEWGADGSSDDDEDNDDDDISKSESASDSDDRADNGKSTSGSHSDSSRKIPPPLSRLRLIDFAHAKYVDGMGPDDNVLDGVENLISIFGQLLAHSQ